MSKGFHGHSVEHSINRTKGFTEHKYLNHWNAMRKANEIYRRTGFDASVFTVKNTKVKNEPKKFHVVVEPKVVK